MALKLLQRSGLTIGGSELRVPSGENTRKLAISSRFTLIFTLSRPIWAME